MTSRQRELHERLGMPEAVLTRTDLADLGYPRRAVDVIFKHIIRQGSGVQNLPGFSRPMIRVGDFLAFRDRYSYRERVIAVVGDDGGGRSADHATPPSPAVQDVVPTTHKEDDDGE